MTEYQVVNKTYIKSSNNSSKILFRYTIALIIFLFYVSFCYLIKKDYSNTINLFKTFLISSVISFIFQYIINLTRGNKKINKVFTEDNILASSIIVSLGSPVSSYFS